MSLNYKTTLKPVTAKLNNSSAVAEMNDRGHNRHGPKRGGGGCGAAVHLLWELGPRLIRCGLGPGLLPYQAASCSTQPFGHKRRGPKIGGSAPFGVGAGSPSNTKSPRLKHILPYQVASWCIQPFGHSRNGPKINPLEMHAAVIISISVYFFIARPMSATWPR